MIHFGCPRCNSAYQVPEDKGGRKTACPKCGQRLQIPNLSPNKTILAPILPAPQLETTPPSPIASPAEQSSPNPYKQGSLFAKWWDTGHSVLGIQATIAGGASFVLILLAGLVFHGWLMSQDVGSRMCYLEGIRDLTSYTNEGVLYLSHLLMGISVITIVGALIAGGLSFRDNAKRNWSIAACVVNGLLLFWILLRANML